jgi:hypothetical protein
VAVNRNRSDSVILFGVKGFSNSAFDKLRRGKVGIRKWAFDKLRRDKVGPVVVPKGRDYAAAKDAVCGNKRKAHGTRLTVRTEGGEKQKAERIEEHFV